MPFNKYRQKAKMKMVGTHLDVLINAYTVGGVTLQFPCKDILSLDDVSIIAPGYVVAPVSKLRNTVLVRVLCPDNPGFNIANHTHDILVAAGSGAGKALVWSTGADLNELAGAGGTILSGKASGVIATGVANSANMNQPGVELPNAVANSPFTVYGSAIGYN